MVFNHLLSFPWISSPLNNSGYAWLDHYVRAMINRSVNNSNKSPRVRRPGWTGISSPTLWTTSRRNWRGTRSFRSIAKWTNYRYGTNNDNFSGELKAAWRAVENAQRLGSSTEICLRVFRAFFYLYNQSSHVFHFRTKYKRNQPKALSSSNTNWTNSLTTSTR